MQSIFVFCDIAKVAAFWWKNADVTRTQGVCQMIHIFELWPWNQLKSNRLDFN